METERNMTVFKFEGAHEIRTVVQNGEPWFVAKDVCLALDVLWQGSKSLEFLDEDEKGVGFFPTPGGNQDMLIISESGLYTLLVRSNKPQAKVFRKWVTSEVLPTIRKTGHYEVPVQPAVQLIGNESNLREFKVWKEFAELCGLEGNAALISADNTMRRERNISMLRIAQIELKNPDQQALLIPTEIAERLKLSGPREANILLAAGNFQHKMNKKWALTEKGKQFAVLLDTGKRHSDGTMIQQLKWKESIIPELKSVLEELKTL